MTPAPETAALVERLKEGRILADEAQWSLEPECGSDAKGECGPNCKLRRRLGEWIQNTRPLVGESASLLSRPPQPKPSDIELKYRKLLWLGHGHQGLYGDDGEMQCARCGSQHQLYDYKRAPLEDVERVYYAVQTERMLAQPEPQGTASERDEQRTRELMRGFPDLYARLSVTRVALELETAIASALAGERAAAASRCDAMAAERAASQADAVKRDWHETVIREGIVITALRDAAAAIRAGERQGK